VLATLSMSMPNFNCQKSLNIINNFNGLNQEFLTIMPNFRVHNATLSSEFIMPNKKCLTSSTKRRMPNYNVIRSTLIQANFKVHNVILHYDNVPKGVRHNDARQR